MAADLITEHYNNGDEIPNIMEASEWIALVTGGFCYYNNTRGNAYSEMTAGDILVHSHDLVRFKDTDTIRWRINEISATEIEVIADGSILEDDVVALQMQSDWNQSNTESADYIKNKPEIAPQVQSDWEESDSGEPDYIWNKPDITAHVQSDWEESESGEPDYIWHKPELGTISPKDFWTGTLEAYEAIEPYDSNTIYFVEEE